MQDSIIEFRKLSSKKSLPLLYPFINHYKTSEIKEIFGFANGPNNNISAVENVIASDLSNGVVKGINSKLKMVKRTM